MCIYIVTLIFMHIYVYADLLATEVVFQRECQVLISSIFFTFFYVYQLKCFALINNF